ncbi:MAG TPA: hypothetical protein VK348_12570 [Planctomycetota bacterium]|nr:hypothetical protein [Planctomycetota bacterium]
MRCLAAAVLAAVPLAAQQKLEARTFVPKDYRCEVFVDFTAVKDNGMYDGFRQSLLQPVFGIGERVLGVELAELARIRAYPELPSDDAGPQRHGGVAIYEGSDKIVLPPADQMEGYKQEKVGDLVLLVQDQDWNREDPDLFVSPKPGLLVYATRHLVQPLLDGKATPGVPSGEFLTLTAGRGNLAYVVMALSKRMLANGPSELSELQWSEDDQPQFLLLRLRQDRAAEGDDMTVVAEAVLRHRTGKDGPAMVEGKLREALAWLKQHPRFGAMKKWWNKVELKVDGRDLQVRLPLGKPRDATGALVTMLAPMLMVARGGFEAPAQAVQIEVAPTPAETEKPAEKPKEEKPKQEKPKDEPPKAGGQQGSGQNGKGGGR